MIKSEGEGDQLRMWSTQKLEGDESKGEGQGEDEALLDVHLGLPVPYLPGVVLQISDFKFRDLINTFKDSSFTHVTVLS